MTEQTSLFPQYFQNKLFQDRKNTDNEEVKLINKEEFEKVKSENFSKKLAPQDVIQIIESPYKPILNADAISGYEKKHEKTRDKKFSELLLKKRIRKREPIKNTTEKFERTMPFFSKNDISKFSAPLSGLPSNEILDCDKFFAENFPARTYLVGHKRIFSKKNLVKLNYFSFA
jgi:hypothetical protein